MRQLGLHWGLAAIALLSLAAVKAASGEDESPEAKIARLERTLAEEHIFSTIPARSDVVVVLLEVWSVASESDVKVTAAKSFKPVDRGAFSEQPIHIEMASSFEAFLAFLRGVESLPRITLFQWMEITGGDLRAITARVQLHIPFRSQDQAAATNPIADDGDLTTTERLEQLEQRVAELLEQAKLETSLVDRVPRSILLRGLIDRMHDGVRLRTLTVGSRVRFKRPTDAVEVVINGLACADHNIAVFTRELDDFELMRDVQLISAECNEGDRDHTLPCVFEIAMKLDPRFDVRQLGPRVLTERGGNPDGLTIAAGATAPRDEQPQRPATASVTGRVFWRLRIHFSHVVLHARLLDISGPQDRQVVVSEQIVKDAEVKGMAFRLPYLCAKINPDRTYVVEAWVSVRGRRRFKVARQPVITAGNPRDVLLDLTIGGPAEPGR